MRSDCLAHARARRWRGDRGGPERGAGAPSPDACLRALLRRQPAERGARGERRSRPRIRSRAAVAAHLYGYFALVPLPRLSPGGGRASRRARPSARGQLSRRAGRALLVGARRRPLALACALAGSRRGVGGPGSSASRAGSARGARVLALALLGQPCGGGGFAATGRVVDGGGRGVRRRRRAAGVRRAGGQQA